jgi:hypothetical protein
MEAVTVQLNVGLPKEQDWRDREDISAIGKDGKGIRNAA